MLEADAAMEIALLAVDHAAESVIASGGPLVPFALIEAGGQRTLARFPGDLTRGQAAAREAVKEAARVDAAAVAWDGYLTVQGQRFDAVFAEAWAAGQPESVIVAQRYGKAGRVRKRLEVIGNVAIVDAGQPLR